MEEEPEQARVPQLLLLVGVVGQHEALRHPDDAGARPQQDSRAVEDDGGGEEELEAVEDVEGGSQHEAGGGAGGDQQQTGPLQVIRRSEAQRLLKPQHKAP